MKPELVRRYVDTGKVRFVWHDFAWIGQESRQAAQGARCAARQGKFWEYHDHLYNNQRGENRGQFAPEGLRRFAGALGLDVGAFGACVDKGEDLEAIQKELTDARGRGITATPGFMLGSRRLTGALAVAAFAEAIDAELARLGR